MSTRKRCFITLGCLFILELMPIPFTAMFSLFTVWRGSEWLLGVVERLYEPMGYDPEYEMGIGAKATRKKCIRTLWFFFACDIVIPVTIPYGLYLVSRRPLWFRDTVFRLYGDDPEEAQPGMTASGDAMKPKSKLIKHFMDVH